MPKQRKLRNLRFVELSGQAYLRGPYGTLREANAVAKHFADGGSITGTYRGSGGGFYVVEVR